MKRRFWVSLVISFWEVFFLSCTHGGWEISPVDDYYNLARDFHEQKIYDRAERYYLYCLGLDNNQEDCLYNLSLLYLETKRPDQALAHLEVLLEKDPDNTLILNSIGIAYSQKEEWNTALAWYSKTLEQYPWDRGALYNSALVYEKLDMPGKARGLLEVLWERDRSFTVFTALYPYYEGARADEKILLINQTEAETEEETLSLNEQLLDLYLQEDLAEEALPILLTLYQSRGSRGAWYLFKRGELLIQLYRIEEGFASIREAFRNGYHDHTAIEELSQRLAPPVREVLLQLEKLYFPQIDELP